MAVKISLSKKPQTVTKYGQNLSHRTLKSYDKSIGTFFFNTGASSMLPKKYHLGKTCVFVLRRWWSNSYLHRGFKVLQCLRRDQIKKNCAKFDVRNCFIMYVQRVGVVFKTSTYVKKKPIDSFQIDFGKNGIMRFTLDNDSILLFAQLLITTFSQNIFFGNK